MTEKVFHQNALESKLGYKFKDPELLRQAVTHASLERSSWNVYERLEFLGDRVPVSYTHLTLPTKRIV